MRGVYEDKAVINSLCDFFGLDPKKVKKAFVYWRQIDLCDKKDHLLHSIDIWDSELVFVDHKFYMSITDCNKKVTDIPLC